MKEMNNLYYELGGIAMLTAIIDLFEVGDPVRTSLLIERLSEINKVFKEKTEKEFPKEVTE